MIEFVVVGIGGFIGSCMRYLVTRLTRSLMLTFPLGTLLSNVTAGLLIGFFIGIEQNIFQLPPKTKLFLTTGFLGGLSTFSSFSLETVQFFQEGRFAMAAGNISLNLFLSLAGVVIGMSASKLLALAKFGK